MKHLKAVEEPDVGCFRAADLSQSSRERGDGGEGLRRMKRFNNFCVAIPIFSVQKSPAMSLSLQQFGTTGRLSHFGGRSRGSATYWGCFRK